MSFVLARAGRLSLERDGRVWYQPDDEDLAAEDLGPIDSGRLVAPEGLDAELAVLARAWADSDDQAELHAGWAADYRAGLS